MYAVIRTGGKQYSVTPGATLEIEMLAGNPGDKLDLSDVLLVVDGKKVTIGQPLVKGASVSAKIVEQKRGKKLVAYKKIKRHGYHRKIGHRQYLTRIEVGEIQLG